MKKKIVWWIMWLIVWCIGGAFIEMQFFGDTGWRAPLLMSFGAIMGAVAGIFLRIKQIK